MNWFKRYGIVGAFFLCAIVGWYIFLSGPEYYKDALFKNLIDKFQIKGLVGIATFLFLPAGYLIMVISQWLYYRWGLSLTVRYIHLEIFQRLPQPVNQHIRQILHRENFREEEAPVESILTYMARRWFNLPSQEQMRSLNEYNQKRFDIIAMNNGIAWATIFAFFIALFLMSQIYKIDLLLNLAIILVGILLWIIFKFISKSKIIITMIFVGVLIVSFILKTILSSLSLIFFGILIGVFAYSLSRVNWTLEDQILTIETLKFQVVANNITENRRGKENRQ